LEEEKNVCEVGKSKKEPEKQRTALKIISRASGVKKFSFWILLKFRTEDRNQIRTINCTDKLEGIGSQNFLI
jgi:hypothetical protein